MLQLLLQITISRPLSSLYQQSCSFYSPSNKQNCFQLLKAKSKTSITAAHHRELTSSGEQSSCFLCQFCQKTRPSRFRPIRAGIGCGGFFTRGSHGNSQDSRSPSVIPYGSRCISATIPHSLIWADTNQTWKALRTLCRTELFSAKALETQSRIREEKLGQLLNFLHKKQGQVIDVEDVVFTTLLNTLSSIVFSRDMLDFSGEQGSQDWLKESMHKVIEYGGRVKDFGSFFPMLERFDLHGTTKGTMEVFKKVFAYWEEIIEERRAHVNSPTWSSDQAQSFLDKMLENKFSSNQIYQLVMELFVAGTNTTTSTVMWVMSELVRHKEVMSKIEEETRKEINSDKITISQLSKFTYLQACIKETFRLHPPVPLLLPHKAAETCEVMNYTIPKNTKIFVNLWAMGRDPKIWDEPLSFNPERFIDSKIDFKGQDFELLPFWSGRRICPGLPSGIKSVEFILASLIHEFDWTLPNGDDPTKLDMKEKFRIAMKRENPLKLIFKAKNSIKMLD